jgi:predicted transcriptional regulator
MLNADTLGADRILSSVSSRTAQEIGRDVDGDVLKYLEEHCGEISITRAANDLGITLEQLAGALSRLQSKGMIQREQRGSESVRVKLLEV